MSPFVNDTKQRTRPATSRTGRLNCMVAGPVWLRSALVAFALVVCDWKTTSSVSNACWRARWQYQVQAYQTTSGLAPLPLSPGRKELYSTCVMVKQFRILPRHQTRKTGKGTRNEGDQNYRRRSVHCPQGTVACWWGVAGEGAPTVSLVTESGKIYPEKRKWLLVLSQPEYTGRSWRGGGKWG